MKCRFRAYPVIPNMIAINGDDIDMTTCTHPDNMLHDCPYHWAEDCPKCKQDHEGI